MMLRSLHKYFFALFCISVCHQNSSALDPQRAITQYVHDVWQVKDGLPQNSAVRIVQTPDGYLWLGTFEGIVRFDGIRFEVFDKNNTPQLQSNTINDLIVDSQGNLWIGTDSGLNRYKNGEFILYTTKDGLSHNSIYSFSTTKDGLWIGTKRGLNFLAQGKIKSYNLKDGLTDEIFALKYDAGNGLWIGTYGKGLTLFNKGQFTNYSTKDGLTNLFINALYLDQDKALWIGTRKGLIKYREKRFSAIQGLPNDVIRSFHRDRNGNFWIGTAGGGVLREQNGKFSSYTTNEGLSDDLVHSIFEDREGSVWIGTDGGLNRLKDGRFVTYSTQEGLSHDYVLSVYEDRNKNIWVGTRGGGLNLLQDGNIKNFTTDAGLLNDFVLSITEDGKGNLWVGTRDGLNRYSGKKFEHFTTKNGLSDDFVSVLHTGKDGTLWIGTLAGGLNQFENNKFRSYSLKNGLSDNNVSAILEDFNGGLWIGTETGLNFLKDGKIQKHSLCANGVDEQINTIYQDRPSSLWVAIGESGLCWLNNGKCVSFTTRDGLPHDSIFGIVEDSDGNLWMSCNKGIFRVKKSELEDFANGKIHHIHSVLYGEEDGMKSSECGGYYPVVWKGRDGKLWFATTKGVVMIDPQRIKKNSIKPPVHIEKMIVDNEVVKTSLNGSTSKALIKFPPGKEKFEFHYTALSFLNPKRVRFKYKLEGFDKSWVNAENRRTAYYTHIPAGHYHFHVMASNDEGIWNEDGSSLDFYLRAHFYQTGWFYLLCTTAAFLISFGLYRLRIRQMQERFAAILAERIRIARDLHDTVAQNISTVVVQLDAAGESFHDSPEQSKKFLLKAQDLARESVMQARKAIMELRDEVSSSNDLAGTLQHIAQRIAGPHNISVYVKKQGTAIHLTSSKQNHIVRICEEAVRNAIKHGEPERVDVELLFHDNTLEFCVRDNGKGFDPATMCRDGHFGLTGMQERVEQLGGKFTIHSQPAYGTEIRIYIPLH